MKKNGIFVQRPSLIIPILVLTVCCHPHPETAIILVWFLVCKIFAFFRNNIKQNNIPILYDEIAENREILDRIL